MSGAARIRAAFAAAHDQRRAAIIPYVVAGRPSFDECIELVASLERVGVDVIELGVPFSDPLADGAVIRDATRRALDGGMTARRCLDMVDELRQRGVVVPIVLMSYVNPLLAYGIEAFLKDAATVGVDGLIAADAGQLSSIRTGADAHGLGLTHLVTPLSGDRKIAELAKASTGFLYAVAGVGTTGVRARVAADTIELLGRIDRLRVEQQLDVPVGVGFGIGAPAHVRELAAHVDGVVVGSAIVERVERDPAAVDPFVRSLVSAAVR